MKIAIANDHAGVSLKQEIAAYLSRQGHEVKNYGTDTEKSVDYPDYAIPVAKAVTGGEADCGILICGTGVGMSLAANKMPGIRAAVCSDPTTAHLVKEHNDANILCFGARIVGSEIAKDMVDAYLSASFLGQQHTRRVGKIAEIEKKKVQTE